MIQPDRLNQLIGQEATIYSEYGNALQLYDTFYIDGDYIKCSCSKCLKHFGEPSIWGNLKAEEFFETEEEAKWYLEFGNITREEKLSLPSWEEIKKSRATFFSDVNYLGFITSLECIVINKYSNGGSEGFIKTLFRKPLTKENYIEACRLCKKLFLEENDE